MVPAILCALGGLGWSVIGHLSLQGTILVTLAGAVLGVIADPGGSDE